VTLELIVIFKKKNLDLAQEKDLNRNPSEINGGKTLKGGSRIQIWVGKRRRAVFGNRTR